MPVFCRSISKVHRVSRLAVHILYPSRALLCLIKVNACARCNEQCDAKNLATLLKRDKNTVNMQSYIYIYIYTMRHTLQFMH